MPLSGSPGNRSAMLVVNSEVSKNQGTGLNVCTQLTVVLTVASVAAALAISYVFYRLSTRERRPVYMKSGSPVVTAGGEIEVLFNGDKVPRVTRTIAFFWNAGRESIRSEDVREPVTFRVEDGRLLRATLLKATRAEIHSALSVEGDTAVFSFSHLDRGDGCCLEIMHTGEDLLGVSVSAVVVGVRTGPAFLASPFWDDPVGMWIGVATTVGGLAFLVGSAVSGSWLGVLGGLAATAAGPRLAWSSRRRDRRYVPREFWDLQVPQNPTATGGVTGWRLRS